MIIWIVIAVVVLGALMLVGLYNSLVKSKVRVDEAWSDISVQMKRRFDLIPNLIETVKGYAKHEKETLDAVIKARNAAMSAVDSGDLATTAKTENMLSGTLKSLFALSESYPDLKANTNFMSLQSELVDTEDKIQASRRFYNASVRDYNTKTMTFPSNIFAGMLGFKSREFFEVDEAEAESVKKPVNVKF